MELVEVMEAVSVLRHKLLEANGLVDLSGRVVADGVEVSGFAEALAHVEGTYLRMVEKESNAVCDRKKRGG